MNIHQLSVIYVDEQDRILVRVNTLQGQELRFWFTRRLTLGLMPLLDRAVTDHVARQGGPATSHVAAMDDLSRKAVAQFQRGAQARRAVQHHVQVAGRAHGGGHLPPSTSLRAPRPPPRRTTGASPAFTTDRYRGDRGFVSIGRRHFVAWLRTMQRQSWPWIRAAPLSRRARHLLCTAVGRRVGRAGDGRVRNGAGGSAVRNRSQSSRLDHAGYVRPVRR